MVQIRTRKFAFEINWPLEVLGFSSCIVLFETDYGPNDHKTSQRARPSLIRNALLSQLVETISGVSFLVLSFYVKTRYRTRAIISRGLYNFYPIFQCGLYCRAVNITDSLCTRKEKSSIFGLKSEVYNQEQVMMAHVR